MEECYGYLHKFKSPSGVLIPLESMTGPSDVTQNEIDG